MERFYKKISFLTLAIVVVLIGPLTNMRAAYAEVSHKDVQTIVRVIGFLDGDKSETKAQDNSIAIIYDPSNSASIKSAEQIYEILKKEKGRDLTPNMVSVANLSAAKKATFAFVSDGMSSHFEAIKNVLRENKILSFSKDRLCVDDGCCSVYLDTKGRVEIVVNKESAASINAEFKPIFLMMISVI